MVASTFLTTPRPTLRQQPNNNNTGKEMDQASADTMNLGQRIAHALHTSGLKPAELARRAGVSRAAVSKWQSGDTKNIRHENLIAIADATGFTLRWLISGRGPERARSNARSQELAELLKACEDLAEYEIPTALKILRGLDHK
jgi:transcriptional regulator with XRE-family HTH domain